MFPTDATLPLRMRRLAALAVSAILIVGCSDERIPTAIPTDLGGNAPPRTSSQFQGADVWYLEPTLDSVTNGPGLESSAPGGGIVADSVESDLAKSHDFVSDSIGTADALVDGEREVDPTFEDVSKIGAGMYLRDIRVPRSTPLSEVDAASDLLRLRLGVGNDNYSVPGITESYSISVGDRGSVLRQPEETGDTVFLSGLVVGTRQLEADSVYVLSSNLTVGDSTQPGELGIEAGTEVRAAAGSALLVSRNGRIIADGTASDPIRMRCHDPAGGPGCWGGVVVAGSGMVNIGGPGLPAAPTLSVRNPSGGGLQASLSGVLYGGSNAADSSGVLRHVTIEDAGEAGAGALVLAGVGSGTVVDRVQAHRSGGTGVEIRGGSAQNRRLLVTGAEDTSLHLTEGFTGGVQFLTVQMDPDLPEATGVRISSEPEATPATSPALSNLTVIGGTPFFGKHGALGFEGAGAVVENLLVVQVETAFELDTGACTWFDAGGLLLDHSVLLGSLASVDGPCAAAVLTALGASDVDGLRNSRWYEGDLEAPFEGDMLDDRPVLEFTSSVAAATPSAPFDPTGDHLGSTELGGATWYAGWGLGWQRPSGFASLPSPEDFKLPRPDTLHVTGPGRVPFARRRATLQLSEVATESQVLDLFQSFGLQIIGSGGGAFVVQFPDPGPSVSDVVGKLDSIRAHPAAKLVILLGARPVTIGRRLEPLRLGSLPTLSRRN